MNIAASDFLIPTLLFVFAWAAHLLTQNRQLRRDIKACTALIEEKSIFESLFDTEKRWNAMPCGTRLELGDTGFTIELAPDKRFPYTVFSPEGNWLAKGNDLSVMKLCAEKHADDRAEFAPKARAWTHGDDRTSSPD